jgi:hypothetical protein
MMRVPEISPPTVGTKVTEKVQLEATASEEPQLLLWLKPDEMLMLEMSTGVCPVLVNVTVCAALGVLTFSGGKFRKDGVTLAPTLAPVPLRLTV